MLYIQTLGLSQAWYTDVGGPMSLHPLTTREQGMLNTQGPLLHRKHKISVSLLRIPGMDFVNNMVTILLWRQTSPKSPRMLIPDSSLPRLSPILRGGVTSTLWPADLYAVVRDHTRFQAFQLQNPPSRSCTCKGVSVQSRLKLHFAPGIRQTVVWKPYPNCTVFKYTDSEPPGIRLPEV